MDSNPPEKNSLNIQSMKIVFMNSIGADIWRGGEKWMVNAAFGLHEKGHKVICIGKENAVWLKRAQEKGLETKEFSIHADFSPIAIYHLYNFFKSFKPDIVCCNFEKDLRLGGIAAKLAKVPSIVVRKGLSLIYNKFRYKIIYKYIVDGIITPAYFIKKNFAQFSWIDQDIIKVVHNGVYIPSQESLDREKLKKELNLPNSSFVIMGAGRLFWQKGFDTLLQAVKLVNSAGRTIHVAIAGGGDSSPFVNLAKELGIANQVHFLGERRDVVELMASADVFVLSSVDEGLPNVVLEAMSVGTAVIAADAGGTGEIIIDQINGFVIPLKDPLTMAKRIETLLENESLRKEMAEKGHLHVVENFSIPKMVTNVEKCFYDWVEKGKTKV